MIVEYQSVRDALDIELNSLGQEGWEPHTLVLNLGAGVPTYSGLLVRKLPGHKMVSGLKTTVWLAPPDDRGQRYSCYWKIVTAENSMLEYRPETPDRSTWGSAPVTGGTIKDQLVVTLAFLSYAEASMAAQRLACGAPIFPLLMKQGRS